jgi:hypothetical protein
MKSLSLLIILMVALPLGMSQVPTAPTPADISDPYTKYQLAGQTCVKVDLNTRTTINIDFFDRSEDGPALIAGDGAPGVPGLAHTSSVKIEAVEKQSGWKATVNPIGFQTYAGGSYALKVKIGASSGVDVALYEFDVNVTTRDAYGGIETTILRISGYTPGAAGFTALSPSPERVKPDSITTLEAKISNGGSLYTRTFQTQVTNNPCGFTIATPTITLAEGQSDTLPISLIAPNDQAWYSYKSCLVQLKIFPSSNPANAQTITMVMTVNGVYIDGDLVVTTLIAAIILTAIIFFVLYRKARIEEEILGKPQAPWTIPAEKVYLSHLKKKDQRAWYTVRHYLMEEEYKSSMLWYSAYKRATKGERKRERIIVGHEHVYDRFEQKWAKRMAKPAKMAGRNRGKLEKKVSRAMHKAHKSDVRTYRKSVKGVEKAHDKKVKKALKKWSKLAKKAAKKGAHAPPQPHFDAPTHANAPSAAAWSFDDHKLALKEAKFRAKMASKESKLRAQHTREAAKIKAKVRRKVEKMAKKLDDPSFINSLDVLQD